jgi:hypothetical protein
MANGSWTDKRKKKIHSHDTTTRQQQHDDNFFLPSQTAAARVRRATINEGFFMSIPLSILDTLKWMS